MKSLGRRFTSGLEALAARLPDTRWLVHGSSFMVESPLAVYACRDALAAQFRPVPDVIEWLEHVKDSRPHQGFNSSTLNYPPDALYGWSTYEVKARIGPWPHPFSPWAIATFHGTPEGTRLEGTFQLPRWSTHAVIVVSTLWMLFFWRDTVSADGYGEYISEAVAALAGFGVLTAILVFVYWHARDRFFASQRLLLESMAAILTATAVRSDIGQI
ncbi:MAG: hypothetical protein ACRDJH_24765 [Thermomicrobiales bacterium]